MKALILEQNVKERSLIQHVLEKSGHEAILGGDMEQAWQLIKKGEARFIIADGDAEDFKKSKSHRTRTRRQNPPNLFSRSDRWRGRLRRR